MLNIQKPVLLIDEHKVRQNIIKMADHAARNKVRFRPHFKTHQSARIGEWFREVGVNAITASSVSMAEYFAEHGWTDITIAFPVNLRELEAIKALAARVSLSLLVDSKIVVDHLSNHLLSQVQVWLAVDTGMGREGLAWDAPDQFEPLINAILQSPNLQLAGLLAHFGQTYAVQGAEAVEQVYLKMLAKLLALRENLHARTGVKLEISVGDTPSCSLVNDLSAVDEIRPGNFVFYDIHQVHIGVCQEADIGVGVACPVAAVYPDRQTILIYGGAVHLSKDFLPGKNNTRIFGKAALLGEQGWGDFLPDTTLYSISQEHGLIQTTRRQCEQTKPGDILVVFPAHICLSVSALHRYLTLDNQAFESFVE